MKPYVKRQKNDATDAEAICEAVRRPTMRFVETKAPEQQSCLMLHRTRHLVVRQLNAVTNALRALLSLGLLHYLLNLPLLADVAPSQFAAARVLLRH